MDSKLNALTVAMWQELARAMLRLSADDALRCVVLRGAGNDAFAKKKKPKFVGR